MQRAALKNHISTNKKINTFITSLTYVIVMKIIRTKVFDKDLKRIGATEDDFQNLISDLVTNPDLGVKIKGLGGVRKIRFAVSNRKAGKSGGGRAIYLSFKLESVIFLITAYAKNEQSDLSSCQRKQILSLIKEIQHD